MNKTGVKKIDKMKTIKIQDQEGELLFREFPDLMFVKSEAGMYYCDATDYILKNGDNGHNIKDFELSFFIWKNAVTTVFNNLNDDDIFVVNPANGHVLLEESMSLLLVAYVDPSFAVFILERMNELLMNGISLSDTMLLYMASNRLSKENLID